MATDIKLGWDVEALNKAYRQGYMALTAVRSLLPPGKPVGMMPVRPGKSARNRTMICSHASPDPVPPPGGCRN
jgi:hypothetical protein